MRKILKKSIHKESKKDYIKSGFCRAFERRKSEKEYYLTRSISDRRRGKE
jgi:hypothetical protein